MGLPTVEHRVARIAADAGAGGGDPGGALAGHQCLAVCRRRRVRRPCCGACGRCSPASASALSRRRISAQRQQRRGDDVARRCPCVLCRLGLFKCPFQVPPRAEGWLGILIGIATGAISVATGVFAIPAVPYLQALHLERDRLVQALGLSFTVSTVDARLGARPCRQFPSRPGRCPSLLALAAALIGMILARSCAAKSKRRRSGYASWSVCCARSAFGASHLL